MCPTCCSPHLSFVVHPQPPMARRETRSSKRKRLAIAPTSPELAKRPRAATAPSSPPTQANIRTASNPPANASSLLVVFAHGAGAGASSAWMVSWAERLRGKLGCAVYTFDFPHFLGGRKGPPPRMPRLVDSFRTAVAEAKARYPHSNGGVLLCGKSMGSRVALYLAEEAGRELDVRACIAFGYPVGSAGDYPKPNDMERRELVKRAVGPLLFVHGTRDRVSDFDTVSGVVSECDTKHALHTVETGDHSLTVTKSWLKTNGGMSQDVVDDRIADAVASFVFSL